MATWIEVKVRQEKMTETGKTVKVTEPYLVDALSCTEAEARVVEEITPFTTEFNVLNVSKTKIAEIFWNATGDRFYKVKVNFITIDEKTATEKRTASYILVQASNFKEAYDNFIEGMKGTLADYEIEQICETKIVDVYKANLTPQQEADKILHSPKVQRHVRKFVDACAGGGIESVTLTSSAGSETRTATIDIPKITPDDD